MSQYINSIANNSFKFASASGCACKPPKLTLAILYCINARLLDFLLEEELEDLTHFQKNVFNGLVTGMFYKSTRGLMPTAIGGVTGMLFVTALSYTVDELRERDLIAFEMKF